MIDEKKMEEAAKLYAWNNRSDEGGEEDMLDKKRAFKAGINWLLDNLWHDAKEKPNKEKTILCEFVDVNSNTLVYTDINLKVDYQVYKTNIKAKRITRWLNIDDLMKGGK